MEDYLIDVMKQEGYHFSEGEEEVIRKELDEAVEKNRFSLINKDNHPIGFFAWDEIMANGKLHLYITHMVVFNKDRKFSNLLSLRGFFRKLYGGKINFVFWHSDRRKRFFYNKGEIINGRV